MHHFGIPLSRGFSKLLVDFGVWMLHNRVLEYSLWLRCPNSNITHCGCLMWNSLGCQLPLRGFRLQIYNGKFSGWFEDYWGDKHVEHSLLDWRKQFWSIWWWDIQCPYFELLFESQTHRCPFQEIDTPKVSQSLDYCKTFLFLAWLVDDSSSQAKTI